MKVVAIGDIHGRSSWERIVETEKADRFVFIGDYFDSKEDISTRDQIANFTKIVSLKQAKPDQFVLLFGNHDLHYLPGIGEHYSGFQAEWATHIGTLLQEAIQAKRVQMCYRHENVLFSHAGFSKTWLRETLSETQVTDSVVEQINRALIHTPDMFVFVSSGQWGYSPSGDEPGQGPVWIRPFSLSLDAIDGFDQVVGHTVQSSVEIKTRPNQTKLAFIDALGTSGQYLIYQDADFRTAD